jgi:hypothetical protein
MLRAWLGLGFALALVACGGTSGNPLDTSSGDDGGGGGDDGAQTTGDDGGTQGGGDASTGGKDSGGGGPIHDASPPPGNLDATFPPDPVDGPPTRNQCTNNFGSALSTTHGRLDGTLVALVTPSTHSCNSDSSHLHLQMLVNGSVYDVAVNLDTYWLEEDMPIGNLGTVGAFSEGWHANAILNYAGAPLNLHQSMFTVPPSQNALMSLLEDALANANHLAIFATGYGPTGIHDVHYRGGGEDGAIVVDPLASTSHVFFFCFNNDSF